MKKWHGARETQPEKSAPWPMWYNKSRENGHSGGNPPRVSEDGEDTSHDWKVRDTVTRSSGKPWDWSSGSEHSEFKAKQKKKWRVEREPVL
jgi:hypothetical protein